MIHLNEIHLGKDAKDGKRVDIPLDRFRAHTSIFGKSGQGKTNTQRVIAKQLLREGVPMVWVDAKPAYDTTQWLREEAERVGRDVMEFDMGHPQKSDNYNPMRYGNPSIKTDKFLDLFAFEGEARVWGTRAELFASVAIRAIEARDEEVSLDKLARLSQISDDENPDDGSTKMTLENYVSNVDGKLGDRLSARVEVLKEDQGNVSPIRSELNSFVWRPEGEMLQPPSEPQTPEVDLLKALEKKNAPIAIITVAGAAGGSMAERVGQLVIRDIKSILPELPDDNLLRTLFIDEFGVIATGGNDDATLDLMNKCREFGLANILSVQDPHQVTDGAGSDSVMIDIWGNSEVQITHKILPQESREWVCNFYGTTQGLKRTDKIEQDSRSGDGSLREVEQYRLHPNKILKLNVGQAYVAYGDVSDRATPEGYLGKVDVKFEDEKQ